MGNKNKKKTKIRGRRKIRIRLADPNIPDSYVCEIFDSSLENEEEESAFPNYFETDENVKAINGSKPKNYFEILMSKETRQCSDVNVKEVCSESENKKDKENSKRNHCNRSKSKEVFVTLDGSGRDAKIQESDSSDDETLFVIQRKHKLKDTTTQEHTKNLSNLQDVFQNSESNDSVSNLDSPKHKLTPKKKSVSILNYFSKVETPSKKIPKKSKHKKFEEINLTGEPLKVFQKVENIKTIKSKEEEKKQNLNEQRKPLNGVNKENMKLAPLFVKKERKIIDPETQKSRAEFLMRGLPDTLKKLDCSKTSEVFVSFPSVCHVQQRNDDVCWSSRNICLPYVNKTYTEECVLANDKKFSMNLLKVDPVHSVNTVVSDFNNEKLSVVKQRYADLSLDLIIDGLKQKRDKFLQITKEIEKSRTSKQDSSADELGVELYNTLWIEKYKPKSNEMLGNASVVNKIRKWLQSWKTFNEELKSLVKAGRKLKSKDKSEDDTEDDAFLKDDDENYGLKMPGNVCILSGPNGCGKTTLISALANELEFNVLEVNASSKRTGKIVLSELQEATQSHKFYHVNLPSTNTRNVKVGGKSKKSKKFKKSRKTEKPSIDQANDCKISLILVEDADIVFEEHDDGFFSAITSLVQTSKRPLIFLTNDPSCPYLENLKAERCLVLEMERPNFYSTCAFLDVLSSLEGFNLKKETLEYLVGQNNLDLRKSLLEVQFWGEFGDCIPTLRKKFDLGQLWWGLSKFLYHEDIKRRSIKQKRPKRKRSNNLFDSSDDDVEVATKKFKSQSNDLKNFHRTTDKVDKTNPPINSFFDVLDMASTLDVFRLHNGQEPIPEMEPKPQDGLSLEENMENVSWTKTSLSESLSEELVSLSTRVFGRKCKKSCERDCRLRPPSWEEIRWRESQEEARKELSTVVPTVSERKSVKVDYLPILRNICRLERNRMSANTKRKNRFHHYLNNLGIEMSEESLDTNCEVLDS